MDKIIRASLERINAFWVAGTKFDSERFRKFNDLIKEAIENGDEERVKYVCHRYENACLRDVRGESNG